MKKFVCFLVGIVVVMYSNAQDNTKYLLARSKGKLPSLAYGLGDDRLGGAKMGFVDTNVLFKIVDSVQQLYKVQLSKQHTAFIGKEYLIKDSITKPKPFYLTNSWSVKPTDSCYDVVTINVDERLPYKSWMQINPSTIVVDIFGVQSNTNWITQLKNVQAVKNVYYQQIEDDVVRATIELSKTQHWGYSIGYNNKALVIKVRRQPNLTQLKKLKIAIDAGHGGSNTGAGGIKTGIAEKEYTLLFAKAFQKHLKQLGFKNIVLTRTIDTNIINTDRILWLQQQNPDLLISFHLNSSNKPEVAGTSTYYKHIGFRPLSTAILKRMLAIKLNEFGNIGSFNFALNAPTDFINCLVEVAFLSNADDEQKIIKPTFHKQVAKQVYLGMNDWLLSLLKK